MRRRPREIGPPGSPGEPNPPRGLRAVKYLMLRNEMSREGVNEQEMVLSQAKDV